MKDQAILCCLKTLKEEGDIPCFCAAFCCLAVLQERVVYKGKGTCI